MQATEPAACRLPPPSWSPGGHAAHGCLLQVALSKQEEVLVRIPAGGGRAAVEMVVTARQVDRLAAPLYRRALLPLEDACHQATRLPPFSPHVPAFSTSRASSDHEATEFQAAKRPTEHADDDSKRRYTDWRLSPSLWGLPASGGGP